MGDNEIVKALECCTTNGASCKDCPAFVKVDRSNCKKYFRGALDLINRQKAEIERLKYIEERYRKLFYLLYDPLIIVDANNKHLRPVKRTSKQDVYHTVLKAQEIMGIPHREFPWRNKNESTN